MADERLSRVQNWFQKADNDLRAIQNNLKDSDPPTDVICFHAQQAIEKYMKGVLIYFGKHITKTHDLVFLLTEISNYMPEIEKMEDKIRNVNRYAVEVRYPDIMFEPAFEQAEEAYEIALAVKNIIREKITV